VIAQLELVIGKVEARFAALLALEARTLSSALKGGGKGFAQVQKRLIRSVLGDFPRPGELFSPYGVELLLERERSGFPTRLVLAIPFGQRPVPDKSSCSCGFGKIVLLLLSRVKAYFVCTYHEQPHLLSATSRRPRLASIEQIFLSVKRRKM
jgi:hypothetical protein